MTGWQLITSYWRLNIPILVAIVLLIFVHLKGNDYRLSRKSLIFFSGIVLLFLVTFSSLNFLGQSYLFSAHMIQHIVLLLIVPPLLLAGTDSSFFTLTGFHGLHVLIGLIMLSILLGITISGKFKTIESTALESGSIYWHFVDAVWIVVFSVVYIGAIL